MDHFIPDSNGMATVICIFAMFVDTRLLPVSSVLDLGCSMLAITIAD